jgi:hypothetical protein
MIFKKPIRFVIYTILFFLFASSVACLKQTAYAETLNQSTNDTLISIRSLRKIHNFGAIEGLSHSNYIEGVVVANDEHNNIYKSLCVQDSTGGIVVLIDGVSLYQSYPVGSLLRIRLKNLFLTDYRKMVQIAASVDTSNGSLVATGIAVPLYSKYISVIKENYPILALSVSTKNLSDSLQGRLIRITGVEFAAIDTAQTYADKKNKIGASRTLKFCIGGTISLRTSGYADFAGVKLPPGNGEMVGIYSVFNTEKQILLRDTSDILFTQKRCTGAAWLKNLPN